MPRNRLSAAILALKVKEKLNPNFLRIHKYYIANGGKLKAYTKNDVEIGNIDLIIGEFYKKDAGKVMETFEIVSTYKNFYAQHLALRFLDCQ